MKLSKWHPTQVVRETNLPLKLLKRGKVRDVYDLGEQLLIVATDRISIFDVVLPTPIPSKGVILTQLSNYWFKQTEFLLKNHLIETEFNAFPSELRKFRQLVDRSVLVKKARVVPIECVVRGYLSGSAWSAFKKGEGICGISLPKGLKESDKLPEPIFTPATKAERFHDENISFQKAAELVGRDLAVELREKSLRLYEFAAKKAEENGIIIADTKFEFGLTEDGELVLVDELLTPDSSRFWPATDYEPGKPQKSFDKQYVRDYALGIGWNKEPPAPSLPPEVVEETRRKYVEAFEGITGRKFF
ncbi:phosphoribosylaminoimidazolesuccinocarboxamide synthase [Candidatus Micrarchaeota archaeon]|nr:phosphoribosylaminoimidazolesuccinocarboxamide synthase [Candidatus Micrarchaeota archaeon]